jgi:hypothetical protein
VSDFVRALNAFQSACDAFGGLLIVAKSVSVWNTRPLAFATLDYIWNTHISCPLMIVTNLDIKRIAINKTKADAPLIVNRD